MIIVGGVKLPTMVRVSRLAEALSVKPYWVVSFCESHGVPIARAGVQKIRMIPRDKFLEKYKREEQLERQRKIV